MRKKENWGDHSYVSNQMMKLLSKGGLMYHKLHFCPVGWKTIGVIIEYQKPKRVGLNTVFLMLSRKLQNILTARHVLLTIYRNLFNNLMLGFANAFNAFSTPIVHTRFSKWLEVCFYLNINRQCLFRFGIFCDQKAIK